MKTKSTLLSCAALVALTSLQTLPARELFKLVRLEDDAAAGTTGNFATFGSAIINNSEELAYLGSLKAGSGINSGNNNGIWRDDATVLNGSELSAREGSPAPGAGGAVFTNLVNTSTFQINDSGDIVFRAQLGGAGVDDDNNQGIWYQAAGASTPILIAREGDAAPGTDGVFDVLGLPAQADTGEIYFKVILRGGTVNNLDNNAIYCYDGTLALIYREGDTTPALPTGSSGAFTPARYGDFLEDVSVSSNGRLMFVSTLRPLPSESLPSNRNVALFLRVGGSTTTYLQEGNPLPNTLGMPTSAEINNFRAYSVNSGSLAIIRVQLRIDPPNGVTSANNEAVVTTAGGFLRLLAREGDASPEGGNTFHQFRNLFIGDTAATGLASVLRPGNVDSIYSAMATGPFINIAKEGIAAPGTDSTYRILSRPAMNHAGQLLYSSSLNNIATTTNADNAGLWRTTGAAAVPTGDELISRKGDFEDDICGTIISYDVNAPKSPNGGVSGTGRAINDNDNLVVNMISTSTGFGNVEGVYILGDHPPEFCEPPADELRNVAPGGSVAVSWTAPTVIDDDTTSPPVVTVSHLSGSSFSAGVTIVTYTATDSGGNVSTYRFRIIVTEVRGLSKILTPDFVVVDGDPLPAPEVDDFKVFSRVCINDSGSITFEGSTASALRGVWSNGAGPLETRVLSGDPIFGGAFHRFSDIRILPSGFSAFTADITPSTPTTETGNFIEGPGSSNSLVGFEGLGAPGTGGGVYRQLYEQAVSQSTTSNYSFYPARLRTDMGAGTTTTDTGIWYFDADAASGSVKMVQEGDPVAPLSGLTHGTIPQRTVTGGGSFSRYVFASLLRGSGIFSGNNQALLSGTSTSAPILLLRKGDIAPGPEPSLDSNSNWKKAKSTLDKFIRRDTGRFRTFLAEAISPDGESVAVHATLTRAGYVNSSNDTGIWMIDSAGDASFVAREAHQAPGFAEGVCFDRFEDLLVTDDGELWFRAYLRHDATLGINSSNDCGIWSNSEGFLRFFLHEGELAPNTDAGVVRAINTFAYDEDGFAATLTLVTGTGDALPNNNRVLVTGLDALTGLFEINIRKGDEFEESPGIFRKLTLVDIEVPFNAAGGSGGFCNSVSGVTQQVVLKASFTGNGNGVILRDLTDTDVGP